MTRHKHADLIRERFEKWWREERNFAESPDHTYYPSKTAWEAGFKSRTEVPEPPKEEVEDPDWDESAEFRLKPEPDPYAHLRQAIKDGKEVWCKQEEWCDVTWFRLYDPKFDSPPNHYEVRDKAKPEPKECRYLIAGVNKLTLTP